MIVIRLLWHLLNQSIMCYNRKHSFFSERWLGKVIRNAIAMIQRKVKTKRPNQKSERMEIRVVDHREHQNRPSSMVTFSAMVLWKMHI